MKNADEQAFPILAVNPEDTHDRIFSSGLSKREYFAAMAMQGICAAPINSAHVGAKMIAKASVEIADELLRQLETDATN